MDTTQADTGVIVGRFQVHELHAAHRDIITSVLERHRKVIMFLGVSPTLVTKRNPLDFVARKEMILQAFPQLTVLALPDMPSDKEWSKALDQRIREVVPVGNVLLYGGRDSFISRYFGEFPTQELEQRVFVSGTEVRKNISNEVKSTADFRAGVIYAAYNQYDKVYPTVDVAVIRNDAVLLGRKPYEPRYRFIGGFADPCDESYEHSAIREVFEETGIEIGNLRYCGSTRIDDWRYRNEYDKIITLFFTAQYIFGRIQPQDDISELRFFRLTELHRNDLVPEHSVLYDMLQRVFPELGTAATSAHP
ncbi:MAG: NUDIX domain-containing protein [Bacteroidota bacterium]|nr:NUDIX domain-containing protein [Candidatus Kapabacteria bacterium]MDW8220578.1 NUDIX domain-containing protein [Bacteroidota bacterium]